MCECCQVIKGWKTLKHKEYEHKIFAKLVLYGWWRGDRKTIGKQENEYTSKVYNLNCCPVCGNRLL